MRRFRRYLLAGLAVTLPTAVTAYVLWFLFKTLDGPIGSFIKRKTGMSIPGVGVAATIVIILVAGFMASNLAGKRVLRYFQRGLERIPLFSRVYVAIRQISDAFLSDTSTVFRKVALIEFPRPGIYSLCFLTSENAPDLEAKLGRRTVNVFLPTSPNPTTGFMLVVPVEDLVPLDITVEDGLKMVISGGSFVPRQVGMDSGPTARGESRKDAR